MSKVIQMAQKWDFKKREYAPYDLPDGAVSYCNDIDAEIACAECGKTVTYGECYTSRKIHTEHGIGYAVCEDCYAKEFEEEDGEDG